MKITGASVHDSKAFEEIIDSVTPVKDIRGRARKRPDKLHADKGTQAAATQAAKSYSETAERAWSELDARAATRLPS